MVVVAEIHGRYAGDSLLVHIDAVNRIHGGHGLLVVGDDDELGVFREFFNDFVELFDVGIVQRGIYFVEDAEGSRLEQIERKEQGRRGQRFFATR